MIHWLSYFWPTRDVGRLGCVSEASLRYWLLRETRERSGR